VRDRTDRLLSVVMPAFNESAGIQNAIRTLTAVLDNLPYAYEIIVIDDGSRDNTYARAAEMVDAGFPVRAFKLSRNFGKEAALLAGLQRARGGAVITIDADLQHPPALIPNMVAAWERGAKIVHGVKRDRGDKHWWLTVRARLLNAMLERLGGIDVQNSSDFKLLDRVCVDVLTKHLPERKRFYRGLADWIGFEQVTLEFDVAQRQHGKSGFSLRSLVALALTATISFTSAPLRIVSILGLLTFLLGAGVGSEALWSWFHHQSVSGFMTLIATLLLLGSFIMISLGVIGEYIAKIYEEIKQRPAFIIDGSHEFGSLPAEHETQRLPELERELR
jgi:polyisoprenyl-phosphate glycosyltransferase